MSLIGKTVSRVLPIKRSDQPTFHDQLTVTKQQLDAVP
jgi:hypothetical protein